MRHDKSLFERVRENEQLAEKFYQVELKILRTLNYADFFKVLLAEISAVFAVPLVWFSLVEDTEVSTLVQQRCGQALPAHLTFVELPSLQQVVGSGGEVVLINENLHHYLSLLPKDQYRAIGSIALAPVFVDGELVGTLNQADVDAHRFAPGLNAVLLERLALKLSICLSNVTAHEKLQGLARLDPLTGLFNRRVLEQVLEREFIRGQRYASALSLAFIDLNDFKQVNDTYGHDAGDLVLRHVADNLTRMSRVTDFVARFAGDEFVLILPQTTADKAAALMDRMLTELSRSDVEYDGKQLPVSLCYGIASVPDPEVLSSMQLLKKADQQLYVKKHWHKQERAASVG
jgi:diguanylate cyclase (GGDEF)-like protein